MNNLQTKPASSYEQQAIDFASKYGVKLTVKEPTYRKYFNDDKEERYVFPCKLQRNGKSFSFTFGQSINAGDTEPNLYDILASLTKNDPCDYEEFCSSYGYEAYNQMTGKKNSSKSPYLFSSAERI